MNRTHDDSGALRQERVRSRGKLSEYCRKVAIESAVRGGGGTEPDGDRRRDCHKENMNRSSSMLAH